MKRVDNELKRTQASVHIIGNTNMALNSGVKGRVLN